MRKRKFRRNSLHFDTSIWDILKQSHGFKCTIFKNKSKSKIVFLLLFMPLIRQIFNAYLLKIQYLYILKCAKSQLTHIKKLQDAVEVCSFWPSSIDFPPFKNYVTTLWGTVLPSLHVTVLIKGHCSLFPRPKMVRKCSRPGPSEYPIMWVTLGGQLESFTGIYILIKIWGKDHSFLLGSLRCDGAILRLSSLLPAHQVQERMRPAIKRRRRQGGEWGKLRDKEKRVCMHICARKRADGNFWVPCHLWAPPWISQPCEPNISLR